MKKQSIFLYCILIISGYFLILVSGCKKEKGYFDSMHFVRTGGGQIDFTLYPTDNSDTLEVMVSEYDYKDTTVLLIIANTIDYSSLFTTLHDAMNNKTQINGNFKQSSLPTGTWAYIYFVSKDGETEVTNTDLRNKLLEFEKIVNDGM
jgi:hypothetical protein